MNKFIRFALVIAVLAVALVFTGTLTAEAGYGCHSFYGTYDYHVPTYNAYKPNVYNYGTLYTPYTYDYHYVTPFCR